MRKSGHLHRRLIFGLSVEDSHSKFDTPESRATLQLAHERYNKGIYHELQVAQRYRQKLSPSQQLHITRHTKPTVKGFQAYGKYSHDEYVVQELCWVRDPPRRPSDPAPTASSQADEDRSEESPESQTPAAASPEGVLEEATPVLVSVTEIGHREVVSNPLHALHQFSSHTTAAEDGSSSVESTSGEASKEQSGEDSSEADGAAQRGERDNKGAGEEEEGKESAAAGSEDLPLVPPTPPLATSSHLEQFRREHHLFHHHRSVILSTLEEALESMTEAVTEELLKKRQRHGLEGAGSLFTAIQSPILSAPSPPSSSSSTVMYSSDLVSAATDGGNGEDPFFASTAYPRHPHQGNPQHTHMVDRLVDEMVEAQERGYKPLSNVSAWFDPIQLRVVLNEESTAAEEEDELQEGEEDRLEREINMRRLEEAFHSPYIAIPVAGDNVSFSLFVAGGLLMNETLMHEFPYHIARFFVSSPTSVEAKPKRGKKSGKRRGKHATADEEEEINALPIAPAAEVEVYFSAELYRISKLTGMEGIRSLRIFMGRTMQAQHTPTSLSQSILLNPLDEESLETGLSPSGTILPPNPSSIRIPWRRLTNPFTKNTPNGKGSNTDDLSEEARDGGFSAERKREAVQAVWRAWGHLVKDLHVHGDLDYLYVLIHQKQDQEETEAYIRGVQEWSTNSEFRSEDNGELQGQEEDLESDASKPVQSSKPTKSTTLWGSSSGSGDGGGKRFYLPIPVDFTVIECVLEKRGLPHNMVVEDITESLKLMQEEGTAMMRLAVMDEWALKGGPQRQSDGGKDSGAEHGDTEDSRGSSPSASQLLPVVYSPNVVISHAGVVERGAAHTFQRIRIRGSQLVHVRALATALESGHLTDRSGAAPLLDSAAPEDEYEAQELPPNLSFAPYRASEAQAQRRRRARQRAGNTSSFSLHHPSRSWSRSAGSPDGEEEETRQDVQRGLELTEDEREFWKTHYYRLSNPKLLFFDRADASDVLDPSSTRLESSVLQLTASQAAVEQEEEVANTSKGKKKKKGRKSQKPKAKHFSTDQLFRQVCVSIEKEAAQWDLAAGDCPGYQYGMRLRKLRHEETPLVSPALQVLQRKGFINYFSPHRFSSITVMDRHPGLALLKGEFHAAANMIVQQCYVDAALRSEQLRTRLPFSPQLTMSKIGRKYPLHLPDFTYHGPESRHSILARATPMVQILNNALQATQMLQQQHRQPPVSSPLRRQPADLSTSEWQGLREDPCQEAFCHVLGAHTCRVLVHEFLAFVWNDLANQRLQRYGTFAVLPGDLVRVPIPLQDWLPSSSFVDVSNTPGAHENLLTYASRKDVQQGTYHWSDVVLPVPGTDMLLPHNHTTDLYVLTLKRYGIPFNPERRQWDIFNGSRSVSTNEDSSVEVSASASTRGSTGGNPLGLRIPAQYRSLLVQPSHPAYHFAAELHPGMVGDPFQRWGEAVRQVLSSRSSGIAIGSNSPPEHPFLWNEEETQQRLPLTRTSGTASASPSTMLPPPLSTLTSSPTVLPFFTSKATRQVKKLSSTAAAGATEGRRGRHRRLSLPAYPYWYPQHNDGALDLSVRLPTGVSPWMMVRELTKSDVAISDVVQLEDEMEDTKEDPTMLAKCDRSKARGGNPPATEAERAAQRWRARQQQRVFQTRPVATTLALLHQHIFRSSGVRRSLLPTLRSYDSVSK